MPPRHLGRSCTGSGRKLAQEQLGFDADLRRTYISILELGNQQPTLTTILKLAGALDRSASEIVQLVESELSKRKRRP